MKLNKKFFINLCLCFVLVSSMNVITFAASTPIISSGQFELYSVRSYLSVLEGTIVGENLCLDRIDIHFDGSSILDELYEIDVSDTNISFTTTALYTYNSGEKTFTIKVYVDGVLVGSCGTLIDGSAADLTFNMEPSISSGQFELVREGNYTYLKCSFEGGVSKSMIELYRAEVDIVKCHSKSLVVIEQLFREVA